MNKDPCIICKQEIKEHDYNQLFGCYIKERKSHLPKGEGFKK